MATVWRPYTQMQTAPTPLNVKAVAGSILHLADGRTLVDAVGSWWTTCHGAKHPAIVAAVKAQLDTLPHVMLGGLTHPTIVSLTERLAARLPGTLDHIFYSESGSVAVEVALKMACQYWLNQGYRNKSRFLHLKHAYHGDTFYAMSVCDPEEGMHQQFNGCLPRQYCWPMPNTQAEFEHLTQWLQNHHQQIAGLILEPLVQGAGGMKFIAPSAIRKLCQLAHEYEILVLFDEIFTGFGRTGTYFAMTQTGWTPDIVCLGKALSGGVSPFAATVANEKVYSAFLADAPEKALMHGPTFTGHALGAAAALASLDLFEQTPWQSQVAHIEAQLTAGLSTCKAFPGVSDVRCLGAIGVVEMAYPLTGQRLARLQNTLISQGLWCRPYHNIIYTTPSFNITEAALNRIIQGICYSVEQMTTAWHDLDNPQSLEQP